MSAPRRTLATTMALPLTLALGLGVAFAQDPDDSNDPSGTEVAAPDDFTSEISLDVSGDEVVTDEETSDASGTYDLSLNSDEDIVCFDIVIEGAGETAASPAPTANHIHQAPAGEGGPAVWLFPNPEMNGDGQLVVDGCLEGSYNGDAPPPSSADVEADPADFYVDYHSTDFVPGEVRGQLTDLMLVADDDAGTDDADDADAIPAEGGVPAGGIGGPATDSAVPTTALLAGLLLLLAGGAAIVSRRGAA